MLAVVFVRLGVWQLDRLEERRELNQVTRERFIAEPVPLGQALDAAGGDLESLEFRRVTVTGEFDPNEEVLIRSQVHLGQAGFHVITPLIVEEGLAVLVNRGWVPLTMDSVPVEATPPSGRVLVEGWVALTETRPPLGQEEPPGELQVLNRVDIGRIGEQTAYPLASVYVVAIGERGTELPVPVKEPDFESEGSHLAYAIQWFGFALIGVVGFYFLYRRKGRQPT